MLPDQIFNDSNTLYFKKESCEHNMNMIKSIIDKQNTQDIFTFYVDSLENTLKNNNLNFKDFLYDKRILIFFIKDYTVEEEFDFNSFVFILLKTEDTRNTIKYNLFMLGKIKEEKNNIFKVCIYLGDIFFDNDYNLLLDISMKRRIVDKICDFPTKLIWFINLFNTLKYANEIFSRKTVGVFNYLDVLNLED